MKICCRNELSKLTFRALALRQSEGMANICLVTRFVSVSGSLLSVI